MRDVLQPIFNDVPFKKVKVPDNLYSFMMDEYKNLVFDIKDQDITYDRNYQTYTSGGISIKGSRTPFCMKTEISQELYIMCYEEITPMIEEWSGQELEMTWAYGIRNYVRDSILHLHRDRIETHIISCIIYVDHNLKRIGHWIFLIMNIIITKFFLNLVICSSTKVYVCMEELILSRRLL